MVKKLLGLITSAWGKSRDGFQVAFRHYEEGRDEPAGRACDALIARGESIADAWYLKGLIHRRAGHAAQAIAAMRRAVEQSPLEPAYLLMLGELILWEEGPVAALPCFEQGVLLAVGGPMHADALADLGTALAGLARIDEAHRAFLQALTIEPGHRGALRAQADLLYNESDSTKATRVATQCITSSRDTAGRLRRALMLPIISETIEEIAEARVRFEDELDLLLADKSDPLPNPESSVGMTAFYLAYYGIEDRALMEKLAGLIRKCYTGAAAIPDFRGRFRRRKRRVAFVSTNFYTHSIGRTTIGWIRDLPRDDFEVWVFSIAPRAGDLLAEDIRRAADVHVVLSTNMDSIRAEIAAGEPDFLIFADLGMHPLTYYLAFWRLAPVQLVAWGHPVSMGIDSVDHFISADMLEPPGSEQQYSENLLRLSRYFMPRYTRPVQLPEPIDRESLGLPRNAHLYGCPQTMFKLHPDFDEVFASILEHDPAARIVLIESRKPWANKFLRRIERRVGTQIDRILMLPQRPTPEFHKLLSCMDVLLDPFYFGGNNSSAEGLALGIPVITLPAPQLRGRFTLGHYLEMEFDACIAKSTAQFIELALSLGTDAAARRAASERILQSCGRLFDRPDAGVALGEALQALAPQVGKG